jgi:hypothetical protein
MLVATATGRNNCLLSYVEDISLLENVQKSFRNKASTYFTNHSKIFTSENSLIYRAKFLPRRKRFLQKNVLWNQVCEKYTE